MGAPRIYSFAEQRAAAQAGGVSWAPRDRVSFVFTDGRVAWNSGALPAAGETFQLHGRAAAGLRKAGRHGNNWGGCAPAIKQTHVPIVGCVYRKTLQHMARSHSVAAPGCGGAQCIAGRHGCRPRIHLFAAVAARAAARLPRGPVLRRLNYAASPRQSPAWSSSRAGGRCNPLAGPWRGYPGARTLASLALPRAT